MSEDPQTYSIIGAAMEVHRELGPGFVETVYQSSFAIELLSRDIPFQAEVPLPVHYKGKLLTCTFRADFVCFGEVVVETKALPHIGNGERAQLLNQLRATGFTCGLLINFGAYSLEYRRLNLNDKRPTKDTFEL